MLFIANIPGKKQQKTVHPIQNYSRSYAAGDFFAGRYCVVVSAATMTVTSLLEPADCMTFNFGFLDRSSRRVLLRTAAATITKINIVVSFC